MCQDADVTWVHRVLGKSMQCGLVTLSSSRNVLAALAGHKLN